MRELTTELLEPILARDPAGPRITHYDDATGSRIELSALTLANWAAKTANMIRDEFGLQPGARVSVMLPAHWQTAGVLLGAWWAGAEVVLDDDPDAELAFVPAGPGPALAAPEVVVLSLDAFGGPVRELPPGAVDYASNVRVHGDQFRPSGGRSPLLERARAAAQRFSADDRVLSNLAWATEDALVDGFLAVLAAGASLVQVSNLDPTLLDKRIAEERVTQTILV